MNYVDKFVYFNDVQYIRRGWVNRNRIKVNDTWQYITLHVQKAPLFAKINEIFIVNDEQPIKKIIKAIQINYKKTPYYDDIINLIIDDLYPGQLLSELNIKLSKKICDYLNIDTEIYLSSEIQKNNMLRGERKIIEICNILKCNHYINPIGGLELYSNNVFQEVKIKLNFLKINMIEYSQGKNNFIPHLSIIDVLMWNSKKDIKKMLNQFDLIEIVD